MKFGRKIHDFKDLNSKCIYKKFQKYIQVIHDGDFTNTSRYK